MGEQVKEYKCPRCGGTVEFDSETQKMKCGYCDSVFEVSDFEVKTVTVTSNPIEFSSASSLSDSEAKGMKSYVCHSCGGEIIGDSTTVATSCPFCGNPVVMTGDLSGNLKPDLVIPFKIDKNAAKKALKEHFKGKKLLPKVFASENHLDEIRGIYVPFWLFDSKASADIKYNATTVRTWTDRDYRYTETSYYNVFRSADLGFRNVPADGSAKMDDALMDSVEPYDFSQAVDFKTAYLSGYLADKYDVSADDNILRVSLRMKASTADVVAQTVKGYSTVNTESINMNFSDTKAKYALLPVWLLNTTWNGEKYVFAMNGQTGKFVGNLPVDKGAYWRYFFIYAGVAAAVAGVIISALLNFM